MKTIRAAFTLVELLVVIAIIGMLIGMLFPAIGSMREASRRAICQTRMARLGIALQKHESADTVLPPGTTDPKGPIHNVPQGIQMSWTVALLPYLDEMAALKQIDQAAGAYAETNAPVRRLTIAVFACPSDSRRKPSETPASNYAGCHHDVEAPIDAENHGVLFLNSRISQRDVTDGVEHTIYLGEKLIDEDDLGWMSGTRATLRNTGAPISQTPRTKPENDLFVGGFGSDHPGGAHFLFGDGSVRFVSGQIEQEVYRLLGNRADGKVIRSGPTREP